MSQEACTSASPIRCLIFDVDDTLYDVGTGFTAHRNGDGAELFMVEKLGFPDRASAKTVRDFYFEKYHSTAKALTVAQKEGKLPEGAPTFQAKDLAEYWATNLNFDLLGDPKTQFLKDLQDSPLKLVAFSNGPRKYVTRVLKQLGLWQVFGEEALFAVDDVLPFCKPEKEAFEIVCNKINVKPHECVIVEDSMKNIRKAKLLGLKTILVAGKGRKQSSRSDTATSTATSNGAGAGADASELTKPGDAPIEDDPAVDLCVEVVEEMRTALPGLWQTPATLTG
ncbi:Hydrolase [Seminavis robusta]|uniref:Hydrolase n=1 Tax=Seminavis robusta TaxID=568900 RepID=A0A9N8E3M6_9STRA|nr:Hydrolase [Seminavis robusta]|eukprot:Sro511_g157390.1 Hydrolase (281) ;mRNA; r:18312-19313